MTSPPRYVESLLEALGAEPGYRDAVVGDLAEEFRIRHELIGRRAARRWYRSQAVRAVPPLVRSWWRGVRARDLAHLFGLGITAFVLSRVVVGVPLALTYSALNGAGVDMQGLSPGSWLIMALRVLLGTVTVMLTGFIAAALHERAPLTAAFVVGAIWSAVGAVAFLAGQVALGVVTSGSLRLWVWSTLFFTALTLPGATVGGMFRVFRAHHGTRVASDA